MKLKKIFSVVVCMAMMFGTFAVPAMADEISNWIDAADTVWYGDGAASSYEVGTPAELAGLAMLVNEGNNFAGKTVALTADIDLAGKDWTPIGNYDNQFKGSFDGGEKTISNLNINSTARNVGFFGYTAGGEIKDIIQAFV